MVDQTLLVLDERERKFVLNYSEDKKPSHLCRLAGYSLANPTSQIKALLARPRIQLALKSQREKWLKQIEEDEKLSQINRNAILIGLQEDIKSASKTSDKIAGRLGQAKILGLTKDTPTVNIGLFGGNNSQSKEANSSQVIDTRPIRE